MVQGAALFNDLRFGFHPAEVSIPYSHHRRHSVLMGIRVSYPCPTQVWVKQFASADFTLNLPSFRLLSKTKPPKRNQSNHWLRFFVHSARIQA